MNINAEKIDHNKYRQSNADKRSLKTFRVTYDYKEVDADTGKQVGEGDGDSVLVEAVDRETAQDIGQEKVIVNTLTSDPNTRMVQGDESPRPQGVFQVTFAVVKGKYGEGDNKVLENGFLLEEDAKRWKSENSHLVKDWEQMRVVENTASSIRKSARDYFECDYCSKKFENQKGLNIHKGKMHR